MLHTGDHVRTLADVDASTCARQILIPAGTEGQVIEDLNEVVDRENRGRDRPPCTSKDLALVRWDDYDAQTWLRYHLLERSDSCSR